MIRQLGIALVALLFLVPAVSAQPDLGQKIDKVFEQFDKRDSPGCSVAVAKDGNILFEKGYGMANLEYSIPMTTSTVSETGSVAKQFVAAAVVVLAAEGKLSLDDDIRRFLPEVPDFGKKITIRNLITHTSGLRDQNDFFALMGLPMGRSVHTNDEILEVVSRQKRLNFDPGTEYLYSNTGYTLLALVVRRASGKSLAEYTTEQIFKPLGMNSTEWREDFTKTVRNRATAYVPDGKGGFKLEMPFGNVHGAGGLLTTVGDLLIWNENFAAGKVGGPEFAKTMETRARLNDGTEIGYAMGLTIGEYRSSREVAHSGATAGYRTYLARYTGARVSIALLCNVGNADPTRLARRVADLLVEDDDHQVEPPNPNALSPDKLIGLYRSVATGEVLALTDREGKLFAGFKGETDLGRPLRDGYRVGTTVYAFSLDSRTGIVTMTRRVGKQPAAMFRRVSEFKPKALRLKEFAGSYFSDELRTGHSISIRDGKLRIRVAPQPEMELIPLDEDAFRTAEGSWQLTFTRDRNGRIDGYTVFTGRIRHLRFDRK